MNPQLIEAINRARNNPDEIPDLSFMVGKSMTNEELENIFTRLGIATVQPFNLGHAIAQINKTVRSFRVQSGNHDIKFHPLQAARLVEMINCTKLYTTLYQKHPAVRAYLPKSEVSGVGLYTLRVLNFILQGKLLNLASLVEEQEVKLYANGIADYKQKLNSLNLFPKNIERKAKKAEEKKEGHVAVAKKGASLIFQQDPEFLPDHATDEQRHKHIQRLIYQKMPPKFNDSVKTDDIQVTLAQANSIKIVLNYTISGIFEPVKAGYDDILSNFEDERSAAQYFDCRKYDASLGQLTIKISDNAATTVQISRGPGAVSKTIVYTNDADLQRVQQIRQTAVREGLFLAQDAVPVPDPRQQRSLEIMKQFNSELAEVIGHGVMSRQKAQDMRAAYLKACREVYSLTQNRQFNIAAFDVRREEQPMPMIAQVNNNARSDNLNDNVEMDDGESGGDVDGLDSAQRAELEYFVAEADSQHDSEQFQAIRHHTIVKEENKEEDYQ